MKFTSSLITGVFASFAAAWCGLIALPQSQIGTLQPQVDEENADVYPVDLAGIASRGRQVYIEREWGSRRTVALDYIYENPVTLGTIRNGPDLSNAGASKSEDSKLKYLTDPQWLYRHLYNAQAEVEGSIMPPFRFLFKKQKISGERSADALALTGNDTAPAGYEIVPTPDARALVAYLLSLDKSHPLKESKGAAPASK